MDTQNLGQQVPPVASMPPVYNQTPNITPNNGGSKLLTNILIIVIAVVIILGGVYYYLNMDKSPLANKNEDVPTISTSTPNVEPVKFIVSTTTATSTATSTKPVTPPKTPIVPKTNPTPTPTPVTPNIPTTSSAKSITFFSFPVGTGAAVSSGIISGNTISVTMPAGTNKTSLVATFKFTGASVSVNGAPQLSGMVANDFTSPVIYTVTAEDGTTKNYTVTVTVMKPTLTWSAEQGDLEWDPAVAKCNDLGSGWRLPTITELNTALTDQFVYGGSNPGGFMLMTNNQDSSFYWSSSPYGSEQMYTGWYYNKSVISYAQYKNTTSATRCVKNN